MNPIAKHRAKAKVGDRLYYNLTDEYRTGFWEDFKIGQVTNVARVYLTLDNHFEFSKDRGIRRAKSDFVASGRCWGVEELTLYMMREQLRKLGAHLEGCDSLVTVQKIATLLSFDLKCPELPK